MADKRKTFETGTSAQSVHRMSSGKHVSKVASDPESLRDPSVYTGSARSFENSPSSDEKRTRTKINYREELILHFYNEMLPYFIECWETPDETERFVMKSTTKLSSINVLKFEGDVQPSPPDPKTEEVTKRSSAELTPLSFSALDLFKPTEEAEKKKKDVVSDTDDLVHDWFVNNEEEHVRVIFKNGNRYDGKTSRKLMHGKGSFMWNDGAYYEGEFVNGCITGVGMLTYPEESYYSGHFCNGMLHGMGVFNPKDSSMMYSGNWKNGKKHGRGWLYYNRGNFYDGEWINDQKEGTGLRKYSDGTIYYGSWKDGLQEGLGTAYYANNDFYKGEWKAGKPHGYGEYTWNAALNLGLCLSSENIYQGSWKDGQRDGYGVIHFGMEGSKLAGVFHENKKHGAGILICGNGTVVQKNPLFVNDSIVHVMTNTNAGSLTSERRSSAKRNHLVPEAEPIDVPIHASATTLNLDYHINKLIDDYCEQTFTPDLLGIDPSLWGLLQAQQKVSSCIPMEYKEKMLDYNKELRRLRSKLDMNIEYLEKVYKEYAMITSERSNLKCVMSRLFLWQFYKDCDLSRAGVSLIDTDNLLLAVPNNCLETEYYPFEKIFLWQFLHSILCVAYRVFASKDFYEEYKEDGIMANVLQCFINSYIKTNECIFRGICLFKYKDLLPITPVYLLYRSLGEPHTAKTFLRRCCVKTKEDVESFRQPSCLEKVPEHMGDGINAVCTGTNFLYLPKITSDINQSFPKCPCPFDHDQYYNDLKKFRKLGPKKVIQIMCEVCPHIADSGMIVNMDYELTFLEFYEVLILCAEELYTQIKAQQDGLIGKTASPGSSTVLGKKESLKKVNKTKKQVNSAQNLNVQ